MRCFYCFQAKDGLRNKFFQSSNPFITLFLVFVGFIDNFERGVNGLVLSYNGFSHQPISQICSLVLRFLLLKCQWSVLVKRVLGDLLGIESFFRVFLHQVFYHTLAVFRNLNIRPIWFVSFFIELKLSHLSSLITSSDHVVQYESDCKLIHFLIKLAQFQISNLCNFRCLVSWRPKRCCHTFYQIVGL